VTQTETSTGRATPWVQIIFAWINDEHTLRAAGSKNDPYAVFKRMLMRGNPPDNWNALQSASHADWQ
jgi:toxin YhaV